MLKKLFFRRSLKDVLLNLSASDDAKFERTAKMITDLNDLYLACTYGDHFKQQIESERAMIAALRAEKKLLERDIALIEESLNKED
jgi:hypothetical protein